MSYPKLQTLADQIEQHEANEAYKREERAEWDRKQATYIQDWLTEIEASKDG